MIKPDLWVPSDNLTLEPNALLAAKEQTCSLALTAGPGAGKTEMLAQKADFLLRTSACPYPKRILAISFKKDASKNLKERVQLRCGANLSRRFDSFTFHAFAKRIIDKYRVLLTGLDELEPNYSIGTQRIHKTQIDFESLVPLAIQIVNSSSIVRNSILQTYSDVFLDEFQDCTEKQYKLIKAIFHNSNIRLTAVGDTKQKIMSWAGALEGIFLSFTADFNAKPLNMYRNFRSKPKLLRLQNEIIRYLDPSSVMRDDLIIGNDGSLSHKTFPNSLEEAEYLSNLIQKWIIEENIPPSEIAILVSKQIEHYAVDLISALRAKQIPFRNEQRMQDIASEKVAKLIINYLLCLYSQRNPHAWTKVNEILLPFETDEELKSSFLRDFNNFFKEQKRFFLISNKHPPIETWQQAISNLLTKLGIATLATLSPEYESETYLYTVIADLIIRIQEQIDLNGDLLLSLNSFGHDNTVKILTIHKSKGLEFHSVILLGVENEAFWGNDARSVFFVGVSRAKDRLVLTESKKRPLDSPPYRWKENTTTHEEFFNYRVD
ncbi:UvrD-helicase domain-containing protein [Acinetobacter baumannii]|uniref:ATP-dependent helicase n=1 Tax=Acinetobacter baumannii TaxID=470 RepID=UPI0004610A76|nr:ATP-dependent helicase [Acinetobacter baumannii]KCY10093.1 uvrD/REP helicase N-terminal domain protein [Acinetobacter baumannii 1598530]MDC5517539.1 ATP-dependent helicase [Acinetobacter baumannii]TPV21508.1 ATP-dependent helicase [Acinetobacter baumannii]CAI3161391.1 ATP-dependent DNA helicase PcrA [Acinetobacter baumannii]HAV4975549.1 ATP-dependent helicase [Acinetobacter baumannii]